MKLFDSAFCEAFLDTAYGRAILRRFNVYKSDIEDPAPLIINTYQPKGSPRRYLDIGGGTGERTIEIAQGLRCRHVDLLEPSSRAAESFRSAAKRAGLSFSVVNGRFEDYAATNSYDLITSIHSWYYIDIRQLSRLSQMLVKGGVAYIFMDSREDTIKRIQDLCEARLYSAHSNNAEDLCRYLNNKRIRYRVYRDERVMTGLLKFGKLTEKAKTIITFVAWKKWKDIHTETKSAVEDMLIGISHDDQYPCRRWLISLEKNE